MYNYSAEKKEKKGGCFRCGCIGLVVLLVLGILGGVGSIMYVGSAIKPYTAEKPLDIPVTPLDPAALASVQQRIAAYAKAYQAGEPYQLRLTAEEINGLIAEDPEWEILRKRVHFRFEGDKATVFTSIPIPGWMMMGERYLNMIGEIAPSFSGGELYLGLRNLWFNDRQIPAKDIEEINKTSNAGFKKYMDPNANLPMNERRNAEQMREALKHIRSFQIMDGALVVETGPPLR